MPRKHWPDDQELEAVGLSSSGLAKVLVRPLFGFSSDSVHYLGFGVASPT